MEFTKEESQQIKGIAIVGMIMLHLFCRRGNLPYTPLIWIGKTPLIYYLGLLGDMCVPLYCFCSGYAHCLLFQKSSKKYVSSIGKRILKFLRNYWAVVVLFSVVGLLTNSADLPRSFTDFLGNLLLIGMNYNGAWWFVVTYLILCAISPILCELIDKTNAFLVLIISCLLYFVFYLFRFQFVIEFDYFLIQWLWDQVVLLGTSQFGYMLGVVFYKNKWISALRICSRKKRSIIWVCAVFCLTSMITHCFIESVFLAPFIAVPAIIAFAVIPRSNLTEKILLFLGRHSTNIWLTHMFFYLVLFSDLVFVFKYPVLIVIFMFFLCIGSSLIIDTIKDRLWRLCHD